MDVDWSQFFTPGQLGQAAAVAGVVRFVAIPVVKQMCPKVRGWATVVWALGTGVFVSEVWAAFTVIMSVQSAAAALLIGLAAGSMAVGYHQAQQAVSPDAKKRAGL